MGSMRPTNRVSLRAVPGPGTNRLSRTLTGSASNGSEALLALVLGFASPSVSGCATLETTSGITPVTGIVIRSDALTADLGCGKGDREVFRYAAIVIDADGKRVASSVNDCFADGAFVSLFPSEKTSSLDFRVTIRAWNHATYTSLNEGGALDRANSETLEASSSTWRTDCTATQQQDVQVLALCSPLGTPKSD
ncbi:MAG: hypothetical protein U0169_19555 [Polyangiaceae bacterium]